MLMLLGTWWELLLGRSEEWDIALEVKVRANEDDVVVECEGVNYAGPLPCDDEG